MVVDLLMIFLPVRSGAGRRDVLAFSGKGDSGGNEMGNSPINSQGAGSEKENAIRSRSSFLQRVRLAALSTFWSNSRKQ